MVKAVLDHSHVSRRVEAQIGTPARDLRWTLSRQGRENPLAHTLRQLGIGVLTPDSVEAYKTRIEEESKVRLAKLQRKIKRAESRVVFSVDSLNMQTPLGSALLVTMLAGLLLCAIAVINAAWGGLMMMLSGSYDSWSEVGWVALIGVTLMGLGIGSMYLLDKFLSEERIENSRRYWREKARATPELKWATTKAHRYGWEIPETVRGQMTRLQEALPGVEFKVVHTVPVRHAEIDERVWALRPDPFLVARYRHEELHIAYWNEEGYVPRFK